MVANIFQAKEGFVKIILTNGENDSCEVTIQDKKEIINEFYAAAKQQIRSEKLLKDLVY